MDSYSLSHSRYKCQYHVVFIPKYRKRIMYGKLKADVVSDVIAYIKGKSALMIHDKYPEMVNGWSKSFWARGYYVATVGNITEEAVKEYIQQQKEESKREDTRR